MNTKLLEELIILAHNPEKGGFQSNSTFYLTYALVGGLMFQLSSEGKMKLENNKAIFTDLTTDQNPVIEVMFEKIRTSKKQKPLKYWIGKLSHKSRKLRLNLVDKLISSGKLELRTKKFLGIIPFKRTFVVDLTSRNNLIQRLKNLILMDKLLEEEDLTLLSLIHICKLYKIFSNDKSERKKIAKKLEETLKNSPISESVNKTIKEVQTAIMVSVIASSVVTSSSSS